MKQTKVFSQTDVIKKVTIQLPTKGVCFRLTFKWAACKLVAGDFNYEPYPNKIATKHSQYRAATLAIFPKKYKDLSNNTHYNEYIDTDYRETALYVNTWGKQFKDKNKTTYSGVKVISQNKKAIWENELSNSGNAILGIFYGRDKSGVPFGHVIAFAHDITLASMFSVKLVPTLFDSNYGEFIFNDKEDMAEAIKKFIITHYSSIGTIDRYNTLILGLG
jgi:hypothetical protein